MTGYEAALPACYRDAHRLIRTVFAEANLLVGTVLELATTDAAETDVGQGPDSNDIGSLLGKPLISLYDAALPAQEAFDQLEFELLRVAGDRCEHERALAFAHNVKVAFVRTTGMLEPAEMTTSEIGRAIAESWQSLLEYMQQIPWLDHDEMLDRLRREIVLAADKAGLTCAASEKVGTDDEVAGQEKPTKLRRESDNNAVANKPAVLQQLLRVWTENTSDERVRQAVDVIASDRTVHEKIELLDETLRIPATASAKQLAELFRCSKSHVIRSPWWQLNRSGKQRIKQGSREQRLRGRAESADF